MSSFLAPSTPNGTVTYGYLVDMVERYFNAVDDYDIDGVLSLFNEDAVFTIQSAHSVHTGRDEGIRQMYVELFENYRRHMRHIHFRHVADPDNNRVASQFTVELTDNDGNDITLTNANFFYLENGKFSRVYVYMSDGANVLN
ncbi:nuclear transport factor 2 family protein [Actinomadura chibensis]|uniref:Nuclear transport factor 2 family protein n=1 Tax=Actinomadura chibensis TaxID=392828 RepID=A0A5D0NZA1_9ACTN|nr:nuclear transport factor 2 family protein [Actinomadura chibensis]TYB49672.1 nuclear transport factor 2 family protein [Actinomadura chibensis]